MSIIFKRAHLLSPADDIDALMSVKISDSGMIESIETGNDATNGNCDERVIDLEGKLLVPGLFDMHCHFRDPGQEYKETLVTGSAAAAAGGFTGVALMPNTSPVIDSPLGVAYIRHHAATLPIDLEVIGAMTVGSQGERLAPFGTFHSYGVKAVSDDGTAIQNSQIMRLAFEYASNFDLLVIQHCEDKTLSNGGVMNEGRYSTMLGLKGIPEIAEAITLGRDLQIMRYLQSHKLHDPLNIPRYHVAHISTCAAIALVREAKAEGLKVTCEITPHHFTLTDEDLFGADAKGNFIMKPPLGSRESRQTLIEAVADGTIDVIATDHAPHAAHEKECPPDQVAFGITGLETAVGLTLSELVAPGVITLKSR